MFKQKPKKSVGCGHKNKHILGLASTFFGVATAVFCVLQASATATIGRIFYVGSVAKAFDIKAVLGEDNIDTAKPSDGFGIAFKVGEDTIEVEDFENGDEIENNGVVLTLTGVNSSDEKALTINYNIANTNEEAKEYSIGTYAATAFAGNENNQIARTGNSAFRMLQDDSSLDNYEAEMTLSLVPAATTTWLGSESSLAENIFVQGADDSVTTDSALAFAWTGTIDVDESINYSLVATPEEETYEGTVTFHKGIGESATTSSEDGPFGTEVTVPAHGTYNGYENCGWYSANPGETTERAYAEGEVFVIADTELDIYERCEAIDYDITYDYNGGAVATENPTTYNIESEPITLVNPTLTGYTFNGWTGTDLEEETVDVTIATGSYGNRAYGANWQINQYTISFDSNGGSLVDDITDDYNVAVTAPENPTRTGYDFDAWYSDEELEHEYTFTTMPAGDITLYAGWTATPYDITYDLDGGEAENPATYTIESENIVLNRPEWTGYRFLGWTGTDLASYTLDVTIPAGSIGDREYVAHWEHVNYTINFIENGGSTVSNIIKFYGETVEEPNEPTRTGYDFDGWYTEEELENEYTFTTMPATDFTLYAGWTPTIYDITYDFNGGNEVANPDTYTIETPTFGLNNPTRTGYTFTGWTGTEVEEPSTNVSIALGSYGDREYTANWQINQYTISFDSNGGTEVTSITGDYNSIISSPEEGPTRTGYTFTGWYADPECTELYIFSTIPAEDITVYAGWEVTEYDLTVTTDAHSSATVSENGEQIAALGINDTTTVVTTYFKTNLVEIVPEYGYYVSGLTLNGEDKLDEYENGEFSFTEVLADTTVVIETTEYARADYTAFETAIASIPSNLSLFATNPVAVLTALVDEYTADRQAYNDRYIFDQSVVDGQTTDIVEAINNLKLIGTVTEDEADATANFGGAIITSTPEELVTKIGLTEGEDAQRVGDGVNVTLNLSVVAIEEDEEDPDQSLIRELLADNAEEYPTAKIAQYLDVTLTKTLDGQSPIIVTETTEPIAISAELPEEILEEAEDSTREFYVARVHNGEVTVVDAKLEGNRLGFESDEFSTFAIITVDVPNVPDTGRFTIFGSSVVATFLQFALPIIALSGIGYGIYLYRRRSC